MGVAVLSLVVVAIVAIIVVAVGLIRSRARSHASDLAGIGANEFLQAPPTSFPTDLPDVAAAPVADPTAETLSRGVDRAGPGGRR